MDSDAGFSVRPPFSSLPASVIAELEEREGTPLDDPRTRTGGFSSGVACLLRRRVDGRDIFVKAIRDGDPMAGAHRSEARLVPQLPEGISAPDLRHGFESGEWIVLSFDAIDGECPSRWDEAGLEPVLEMLSVNARLLTPNPLRGLRMASDEMAEPFSMWQTRDEDARSLVTADAAAILTDVSEQWPEAVKGETALHFDVRADNIVVDRAGRAWLVDWSWPLIGAAWLDLALFLITTDIDVARADEVFDEHPLSRDVAAGALDAVLAAVCGYWLSSAVKPGYAHAPGLRPLQRRCGETCLSWLRLRGLAV